jgi:hypothetical protein
MFLSFLILAITIHMTLGQKTLLKDLEAITLHRGYKTTGRRMSPISQLKCVGGCHIRQPSTVQCQNKGSDGTDVQWECLAELDEKYKFGRIEVMCEGYKYPTDPYVLTGSCGLEYTIEYTSKGHRENNDFIGGLFMLVIIYAIIGATCSGGSPRSNVSHSGAFLGGVATSSYYGRSRYSGGYSSSHMSSGFGGTRRR